MSGELNVHDLWAKKNLGKYPEKYNTGIEPHGCKLMKVWK